MITSRTPLRNREQPISSDVADALFQLLRRDQPEGLLPVAYSKSEVVERLIVIANTLPDGNVTTLARAHYRALYDLYANRLTNSIVFQSGYKRYEAAAEKAVVPVTEFFFHHVLTNDVVSSLSEMTEFDIVHSLPKRTSTPVKQEEGIPPMVYVQSGEIAGVIIFPKGFKSDLLRYWLERRVRNSLGGVKGATTAVVHASIERTGKRLERSRTRLADEMNRAVADLSGVQDEDE